MSTKTQVDTMDWNRSAEVGEYMRQAFSTRYRSFPEKEQVADFIDKHWSDAAFKQKLRDDRYRILIASSGKNICGVLLLHWTSGKGVILDIACKPRRKQTLNLLLDEAIRISGTWGFARVGCWLFPEEKEMIVDLQKQSFENSSLERRDKVLAEHPQIEMVRQFGPTKSGAGQQPLSKALHTIRDKPLPSDKDEEE